MTLYTIAYNGYGKFLEEWCKNAVNQTTKPSKIIIVLGENHGADRQILKKIIGKMPYDIIYSDAKTMGGLRNAAVRKIEGWSLYFSADDILLPNAIQEIMKYQKYDAVALRYIERSISGIEKKKESAVIKIKDVMQWSKFLIPAYIAVKEPQRFLNIEIPNYPFLFELAKQKKKITLTDNECAIYVRREGSHGDIAKQKQLWRQYKEQLNEYATNYTTKYIQKQGNVKIKVIKSFIDITNNQRRRKGEIFEATSDRALDLIIKKQKCILEE